MEMLEAAIGTLANALVVTPGPIPAALPNVDVYVVSLLLFWSSSHYYLPCISTSIAVNTYPHLDNGTTQLHPPSCYPPSLHSEYFLVADDTVAQSSGASAQKFANLHNQKRNSQDASATARRASFAEMNKAPGFFRGMWQNWTKGTGK